MTAPVQSIPARRQETADSKVRLVAFAVLAVALIVAVTLTARLAAPAGSRTTDGTIGAPSGGLSQPGQLAPYVPHTSYPTIPQPRITQPLHPPRNPRKGVDPVQSAHARAI